MSFDRPLALAGFFGYLTLALGEFCQVEGAMIPWRTVVVVSLVASALAGAAGFVFEEKGAQGE